MLQDTNQKTLDVDELVIKWNRAIEKGRSSANRKSTRKFFKKHLVDPILVVFVSTFILVLPQSFVRFMKKSNLNLYVQNLIIRSLDVFMAIIGLIFAIPVFLIAPILIKRDSPGPVFYKQLRTGIDRRWKERRGASLGAGGERRQVERRKRNLHGKPFYIYKFRTMDVKAEAKTGAVWAKQDDPRITSIGKWLRKYHVDEIPQLFNVLKGDMTMVGPRPERPEIIGDLLEEIPEYTMRLMVRPGVTGPAQIFLGYDSCMDDIRRKIQFDVSYIANRNLRLLVLILALTATKILSNIIVIQADFFNLNITLNKDYTSEKIKIAHHV
ncbi:MAG: sugar transferase [Calditrichaeota bacterium]|nr:sugar transferase [Calditrichota bacterium]